jgi:SulP family sulfate permease
LQQKQPIATGLVAAPSSQSNSWSGFSRTAVNDDAGAQTNLAAIFSAGVIALTLLLLTPLFYFLPKAVLAAIVMVAVAGLVDVEEARHLWHVDRTDFALMMLTFAATLGLGIEQGILTGVIVSLVVVIYQTSQPHTAVMGRLPGTKTYRNVRRNPEALTRSHTVIVRMDADLYFANASAFKDLMLEVDLKDESLETVIVDMYPVNQIDSTGAHTLHEVIETCHRNGVTVLLAGVKGPVRDVLDDAGITDELGTDHFFLEVHHAVRAADSATASVEDESRTAAPASSA